MSYREQPHVPSEREKVCCKIEEALDGQPFFDCLAVLEAVKAELIRGRFTPQRVDESAATVA